MRVRSGASILRQEPSSATTLTLVTREVWPRCRRPLRFWVLMSGATHSCGVAEPCCSFGPTIRSRLCGRAPTVPWAGARSPTSSECGLKSEVDWSGPPATGCTAGPQPPVLSSSPALKGTWPAGALRCEQTHRFRRLDVVSRLNRLLASFGPPDREWCCDRCRAPAFASEHARGLKHALNPRESPTDLPSLVPQS